MIYEEEIAKVLKDHPDANIVSQQGKSSDSEKLRKAMIKMNSRLPSAQDWLNAFEHRRRMTKIALNTILIKE